MPPPPNLTAATATELGTLPATVAQAVYDGATAYTVWYTFMAPSTGYVGVFGFGDLSDYSPSTFVYLGPASAPTLLFGTGIEGVNRAIQFPVTGGTRYYLEFQKDLSPGPTPVLSLNVQMHVPSSAPAGSIFVPDDDSNFWASILSRTTGLPLRFVDFPAGESMFIQPANGFRLTEDIEDEDADLYGPDLTLIAEIPFNTSNTGLGIITGNKSSRFYISDPSATGPTARLVRSVDLTGAFGPTTWGPIGSSAATSAHAIAVSPDETILYYASISNTIIRKWGLVGNVSLGDLTAGPGGSYARRRQILCLNDGTILACFTRTSPLSLLVIHYSAAGAELHTYDFTALTDGANIGDNQIGLAVDDPLSFWIWIKEAIGISSFRNVRVSDGAILETVPDARQYEIGVYVGNPIATPAARFGHSESCPFGIEPFAFPVGGGGGGGDVCVITPTVVRVGSDPPTLSCVDPTQARSAQCWNGSPDTGRLGLSMVGD